MGGWKCNNFKAFIQATPNWLGRKMVINQAKVDETVNSHDAQTLTIRCEKQGYIIFWGVYTVSDNKDKSLYLVKVSVGLIYPITKCVNFVIEVSFKPILGVWLAKLESTDGYDEDFEGWKLIKHFPAITAQMLTSANDNSASIEERQARQLINLTLKHFASQIKID